MPIIIDVIGPSYYLAPVSTEWKFNISFREAKILHTFKSLYQSQQITIIGI